MANQFNAIIAQQTVAFNGTSKIDIRATAPQIANSRALLDARYLVQITGGVSGTFSVSVYGVIGGVTLVLAGLTNLSAAGNRVLTPVGWSSGGAEVNPTFGGLLALSTYLTNHEVVPPTQVWFTSVLGGTNTGVSANCTVGMVTHTVS